MAIRPPAPNCEVKMNLEDQVVCLELAKRLKELGVEQNSIFVWEYYNENFHAVKYFPFSLSASPLTMVNIQIFSAFTVAELGEMLPNYITIINSEPFDCYRIFETRFNSVDKDKTITKNYIINYECDSTEMAGENAWLKRKLTGNIYDANEANVRAKMLIYLIENNLWKPENV